MMTTRVLIVDDDGPVRRTLARTLGAEGYETALAPDGGAALVEVERDPPDAIVLDAIMPGLDGLAVARRLREKGVPVPILMLTARDSVADRVAGLDAGADDYLVKPFATEELLARLRALLRRGTDSPVLQFADLSLDAVSRTAVRGGRAIELTAREAALLELLLHHPGRVVRIRFDDLGPDAAWDIDLGTIGGVRPASDAEVDTEIAMDSLAFCRAVSNRPPGGTREYHATGDTGLAAAVVDALSALAFL